MRQVTMLAASVAAFVAAAGCSRGAGNGAAQRQPGEWEMVSTIKSLDIPGAPPEMQARIRSQVGMAQTTRECLTAEQTRDPLGQMRQMISQGNAGNCRFSDQTFAGGTIQVRGTCSPPGGGTAQVTLEGTFTETTLQANLTMDASGPASAAMPGVTSVRMAAEVRGRRIGECTRPSRPIPTTGNSL